MEKLRRKESVSIITNSKTFVDQADLTDEEQDRLKNKPVTEASDLFY